MPRKAGVLEGQMFGADRGIAIPSASIRIHRAEDPKEFFGRSDKLAFVEAQRGTSYIFRCGEFEHPPWWA
jgi:hypothetical protein